MKKMILTALLFSFSILGHAAETNLPITSESLYCKVRFSGERIQKNMNLSEGEVGFCSGTLIGSQTLVTASHCLDEAFDPMGADLNTIGNNLRLNIAIGTAESSQNVQINPGAASAVFNSAMATSSLRRQVVSRRNDTIVPLDLLVLRLKNPVENLSADNCPQLPSAADCNDLTAALAASPNEFSSDFYLTAFYEDGAGASRIRVPYPTQHLVHVGAQSAHMDNDGYISVDFAVGQSRFEIRGGDSGTGLIWTRGVRKIIVGAQSATPGQHVGYFVSLCSSAYTNHTNWQTVRP